MSSTLTSRAFHKAFVALAFGTLLAGCLPEGRWPWEQEGQGAEIEWIDAGAERLRDVALLDAFRTPDLRDASFDAGSAALDAASVRDVLAPDVLAPDVLAPDVLAPDVDASGVDVQTFICGNALLEPGERCDDGVTNDCTNTHDGGDGTCVALGTCVDGFVISSGDCIEEESNFVVDIFVSNTCVMNTVPTELTIPAGQSAFITWRNRSVDYPIDVWKSYGGGFLDLPTLQNWEEPIAHCGGPGPATEFADIDAGGCASFRFLIRCE